MSRRLAFVVHRCGEEIGGGSERLCLQVARRLSARGWQVDVLTTCALDYVTWSNHYPAGEERLDGVTIRRFPVARERHPQQFARLCEHVRRNKWRLSLAEQREWVRTQGPWSPPLLAHLAAVRSHYDAFFFFPYLYATTFFGLPLVADRAFLVPAAHDEWPLQLRVFDELFEQAAGFLFLSWEERELLRRRFPLLALEGPIAGVGLDPPPAVAGSDFTGAYAVNDQYLLYLGRIEPAKGVLELVAHFDRYREDTGDVVTRLLLAGPPLVELPPVGAVRCLGMLPEQQKWNALAGAVAIVMPSPFESLSLACLEAWSVGTPALVCSRSEVLVGQSARSGAGLPYAGAEGFRLAVQRLLADASLRERMSAAGRAFVRHHCDWTRVEAAYAGLVAGLSPATSPAAS